MAQFVLDDDDEKFLSLPEGSTLIFAGTSGTESWIEREVDTIVLISMKSVAVALSDGGTIQACIEIGGASAKGEDGPAATEHQLRVSQSVQVLVKAGERLTLKAYPSANSAQLLRTVVWSSDFEPKLLAEAQARASEKAETSTSKNASHPAAE